MPSSYNTKRSQKIRLKNAMFKHKEEKVPQHNIPVVINDKLIVFIDDESKRQETLLKYRNNLLYKTNLITFVEPINVVLFCEKLFYLNTQALVR